MPDEIKEVIDDLGKSFQEFKKTNDERIEKLADQKGVAELEEKLEKMNAEMSRLDDLKSDIEEVAKKAARSGGSPDVNPDIAEHQKAYGEFLRKGHDSGLAELQEKAVNVGVEADGGYAVPTEIDRMILDVEQDSIAMRRVANVITVSNEQYTKLVNIGGADSGWVGETAARPVTDSPQLASIAPSFGEIYANPATTQKALDDVFFDVEAWIASEVGREFADAEEAAFISGNGTAKPKGILAYTTAATADATRAFGTLQHVVTGSAAAITADAIFDLIYSAKSGYRSRASFLMNSLTMADIRKLKDTTNDYLWRPGLEAGQPSTLLGRPVEESADMPDVAADSLSIAFGDFQAGYTIADVRGTRVLRDPFTNKPYVHFYTTKRMGGGVTDSNAIKLLKTSV